MRDNWWDRDREWLGFLCLQSLLLAREVSVHVVHMVRPHLVPVLHILGTLCDKITVESLSGLSTLWDVIQCITLIKDNLKWRNQMEAAPPPKCGNL